MRSSVLALCCGLSLAAGCASSHKKAYSGNPLLLYYKPTLSDSATILAERNARREPAPPPLPSFVRESDATAPSFTGSVDLTSGPDPHSNANEK